jgi:hypothetical protein
MGKDQELDDGERSCRTTLLFQNIYCRILCIMPAYLPTLRNVSIHAYEKLHYVLVKSSKYSGCYPACVLVPRCLSGRFVLLQSCYQ